MNIEIVFNELLLKNGLIPLLITIFVVLLIIGITVIFVIKELKGK